MQDKLLLARLREFEERCREQGLPVTVQRRAILEALLQRDDHPTADQIHTAVKDRIPQLSRTTVYRVLDTFAKLGLVRRLHPTGTARFDGNVQRHHHLVCSRCSKVVDLEYEVLDRIALPNRKAQGFEINSYSIHFSGRCPDCRELKD